MGELIHVKTSSSKTYCFVLKGIVCYPAQCVAVRPAVPRKKGMLRTAAVPGGWGRAGSFLSLAVLP